MGYKGIEYSTIEAVKVINYNSRWFLCCTKEEHMLRCIGSNLKDILNHPIW